MCVKSLECNFCIVIESGVGMKKEYTKLDIIKSDIAAVLMQYENKGYRLEGDFFNGDEFYVSLTNFYEFLLRVKVPFKRYGLYADLKNTEIEMEISGDLAEFKPLLDMLGIDLSELKLGEEISFVFSREHDKEIVATLIGCITLKVINRELNHLLEDIAKEMEY